MNTPSVNTMWWEKTVEYHFVRRILPELMTAIPLAGPVETFLGDLIDGDSAAFRLIEFKRDRRSLNTELAKYLRHSTTDDARDHYFADYLRATSPGLLDMPGARGHWLVYGDANPKSTDLTLIGKAYGATRTEPGFVIRDDAALSRVPAEDLFPYLAKLMHVRSKADPLTSSGGLVVAAGHGFALAQTPAEFLVSVQRLSRSMRMRAPVAQPASRAQHPQNFEREISRGR